MPAKITVQAITNRIRVKVSYPKDTPVGVGRVIGLRNDSRFNIGIDNTAVAAMQL